MTPTQTPGKARDRLVTLSGSVPVTVADAVEGAAKVLDETPSRFVRLAVEERLAKLREAGQLAA